MTKKDSVLKHPTLTKAEMNKIEHVIKGDFAILPTGEHYLWSKRFGYWSRWK